ncbi:hypothetical protein [Paenibacillus wenxiniae]|uniref:Butirosin biosynthesis protein H N-terminal domain-containing protein n=1 Tax=Paenibacillus wenxiniae TaxID=1636843 RepID=A0ABW4RNQ7_9BACL
MKTLPLSKPLISSYPQHAFYLSIISNNVECQPWIYSQYTNMFLSDWKDEELFLDFYVQTPEHHFNPWFKDSQRLHRNLIKQSISDIISFIRNQIDEDYYIWTHIDEYFIPGTPSYKTKRFAHAILIYGYDDINEELHISGFFNSRHYSQIIISYENFKMAFENCDIYDDYLNYTHLLKINPEYHNGSIYQFDILYFVECINNYYKSINETENFKSFYTPQLYSDRTFGIRIYSKLIEYLESILSKQQTIDRRILFILVEHKKFMNMKIKYIEQEGHYYFPKLFKENYERIEKETLIALNQLLKYEITKSEDNIIRLIERLRFIHMLENDTLELLMIDFNEKGLL